MQTFKQASKQGVPMNSSKLIISQNQRKEPKKNVTILVTINLNHPTLTQLLPLVSNLPIRSKPFLVFQIHCEVTEGIL